jgi:hypothetical protein
VNRVVALGCASLLLGGCVRRPLAVDRGEVFDHLPELRTSRKARVELEAGGTTTLRFDQTVEAERPTRLLFGLVKGTDVDRTTVEALIENCPDVAPFREDTFRRDPPCRLQEVDRIVAGYRRAPDWHLIRLLTAVTLGASGLSLIGGTAYCAVTCEEDLAWEPGLALVGVGVGLAGLSVLIAPRD